MERSAEAPRNSGRAMGKSLTVLITGFGPFPGARFNPSGPLVRALARRRRPAFADLRRIGHVFATRYEAVDRELPALIARHRPAAVLMFGLATRTPVLRIETRARNVRSAVLPDAGGSLPLHRSITADGGPEKRGRAPFARLVRAARRARMPARLSHDAGQYLCNYTYWRALEGLESRSPDALAVFVHVPKLRRGPRRAGCRRSTTAADLLRAAEALLREFAAAATAAASRSGTGRPAWDLKRIEETSLAEPYP